MEIKGVSRFAPLGDKGRMFCYHACRRGEPMCSPNAFDQF